MLPFETAGVPGLAAIPAVKLRQGAQILLEFDFMPTLQRLPYSEFFSIV